MGMFDTINVEINCPRCNAKINPGLQTKVGQKVLGNYNVGDYFPINENNVSKTYSGEQYTIWMLGHCSDCLCQISAYGRVDVKSLIIESVEIFEYAVEVKPLIIIKKC